jgi:hypothetical protein
VSGHLFVVRSDLTQLACDAWLLPSDALLSVEDVWTAVLPEPWQSREALLEHASADFGRRRNVFPVPVSKGEPIPLVTNVGGVHLEQLLANVEEFLDVALAEVTESRVPGRVVPLFALPLVGTGRGGWDHAQGDLTRLLVSAISDWVAMRQADVVLVAWTPQAFAAAQSARRRLALAPSLSPTLREQAQLLGRQAALGRLVLFLGAGLGVAAGLPLWSELLRLLAVDAEIGAEEMNALMELNALDAARIVEARLGGDSERLGKAIAAHFGGSRRFGLSHALVASLPVAEAVTTNYDTLFELAAEAAGRSFAVLPYDVPEGDGWLLKLHGSVDHPSDIVLTRGDYLRYADRRAALAGIVQALLITRVMLFVGFSLDDENFNRIADDVRKAVRRTDQAPQRKFGTALLVGENDLRRELWSDDLDCVSVTTAESDAVRAVDLFLDELLATASTGAAHLLDPTFVGALDDSEVALAEALLAFERDLPPAAQGAPAWAVIEDLLQRLGRASASSH